MPTPDRLQRFLDAQEPLYPAVLSELRQGRKASHWMWFIFPQLAGLGRSPTARFYAIADLPEARAYLAHPILGPRLLECTMLVNEVAEATVHQIFGSPDDLKFRSSMTLFCLAADEKTVFQAALDKYFAGEPDRATLALL